VGRRTERRSRTGNALPHVGFIDPTGNEVDLAEVDLVKTAAYVE
jgi:hypothetical protein